MKKFRKADFTEGFVKQIQFANDLQGIYSVLKKFELAIILLENIETNGNNTDILF